MSQQPRASGVRFVNADLGGGADWLCTAGSRIAAAGCAGSEADLVVDLNGDRLLPGLINAHDHLQLNTLPPLESDFQWGNAQEWICAVNARRQADQSFEARVAVPLDERLLIGAVKNLLSGVTTVAHHDPLYPFLAGGQFPLRVVTEYGWSHSLFIDGEEAVRDSYRSTRPSWPWIIHAAEGVDESAATEISRLDLLGCLGPNTLIVHGIAVDRAQRARLERAGAGLIWCPSSNMRLFGRTADVADFVDRGRVALGTDSRLSGSRDLLCELSAARTTSSLDEVTLESLVTRNAAAMLRLPDRGSLAAGARADLLVLPARMPLSQATRADIRLVMIGGNALYADPQYARIMAPVTEWTEVSVDGAPKMLESSLAAALFHSQVSESGLHTPEAIWRAA